MYRFFKKLIAKLRPIEHINVGAYAIDPISAIIKLKDAQPGDLIIMLETGPKNERNHMLLIVENIDNTIKYAHSRAWSNEGKYGHGMAEGVIKITNPDAGLLDQEWIEKEKTGDQNETFLEAKNSRVLQLRRIKL